MIGALISVFLILYSGFKEFLIVLPSSWGSYNEDGKWSSYRDTVAIILTLAATYYFFHLIAEVDRKERVILRLKENKKQGMNRLI